MPRAKSDTVKSSAELDAEIQEMQKKLADKKKAAQAAKRREKAEAEQAKAIEEAEFNKDFVEAAKGIHLSDYEDNGESIYELIRGIIRPLVSPEPEGVISGIENTLPVQRDNNGNTPSLRELMQRREQERRQIN